MRRALIFAFFILLCNINNSSAQFAADKTLPIWATLKAVAGFKIKTKKSMKTSTGCEQEQQFIQANYTIGAKAFKLKKQRQQKSASSAYFEKSRQRYL